MKKTKPVRTIKKPIGKPESFTSAQAERAIKKVMSEKKTEKKYVLIEDIVIKAGTVLNYAGDDVQYCGGHHEVIIPFGKDHTGSFLIDSDAVKIFKNIFVELIE